MKKVFCAYCIALSLSIFGSLEGSVTHKRGRSFFSLLIGKKPYITTASSPPVVLSPPPATVIDVQQEDSDDDSPCIHDRVRLQATQANVDGVKQILRENLKIAITCRDKIKFLAEVKSPFLVESAKNFNNSTEHIEEAVLQQNKFGLVFRGPLNDVLNGAGFLLTSVTYAALLYDEYVTSQPITFMRTKLAFLRFAFQRSFQFKWSLTDVTRTAWVLIIVKIVWDYWW